MGRYKKTKFTGVFYETSKVRRHNGKPDQVWWILIKWKGRLKWERVGWTSEGYGAGTASALRASRMTALRSGEAAAPGKPPEPPAPPPVVTFQEAFGIAWDRKFKDMPSRRNLKEAFETRLRPAFGGKRLDEITSGDVEAVKAAMAGKAPATILQVVGCAGNVFSLMAKWGVYAGPNPARGIHVPKEDNKRLRYLERGEAERLLEELRGDSEHVWRVAAVSLYTGMRRGEVFNLTGDHVNMAAGTISVVDTKSGKNRTVYIASQLRDVLAGLDLRPGKPVIAGPDDRPVNKATFDVHFRKAVDRLGLNDGITDSRNKVVFHTLRHTFASWLVSNGEQLYTVAKLLGHSTIQMTERYAHLMPETRRAATRTLERFVNGGRDPEGPEAARPESGDASARRS